MNNKEIADKCVALGVGEIHVDSDGREWFFTPDGEYLHFDEVGDNWPIAGALMEKCSFHQYFKNDGDTKWTCDVASFEVDPEITGASENESLPRAIIEAIVQLPDKGHV